MIKLEDDKTALYQWDLNQRVVLTNINAGVQVHFFHEKFAEEFSNTCPAVFSYEEDGIVYANIPNIILQKSGAITVYIYVQEDNKAYTKHHVEILVLYRPKPSDYVYTETEVMSWGILDRRIKELEKNSDIFLITFGETTYAEIKAAHDAGKICTIDELNGIAYLSYIDDNSAFFLIDRYPNVRIMYKVTPDNNWSSMNYDIITKYEKVKTISDKPTDDKIPSEKAVYDAILKYGTDSEGGKTVVVELIPTDDDTVYIPSRTSHEIYDLIQNGYQVTATATINAIGVTLLFIPTFATAEIVTFVSEFPGDSSDHEVAYFVMSIDGDTAQMNDTVNVKEMIGATEYTVGRAGLVPAPDKAQQDYVLHGDGTWKKIVIPETVPPGNLVILVGGESPDSLSIKSVVYPENAPDNYVATDSLATGNVTVMVAVGKSLNTDDDIVAMAVADIANIEGLEILAHANLVQSDSITSLMLTISLDSMDVIAIPFTEFTVDSNHILAEVAKNHYTKTETDTALSDKAPKTLIVDNDYGVCTPSADEIIAYRENGGNTILSDVDLGYFQFLCQCGRVVFYGGFVNIQDQIGCLIFQVVGNTVTTHRVNFSEFVKMSDFETIVGMIAEKFDEHYTKSEINAIMGSYVTDIANLIGGEANADS